jgi:hypothetical protein
MFVFCVAYLLNFRDVAEIGRSQACGRQHDEKTKQGIKGQGPLPDTLASYEAFDAEMRDRSIYLLPLTRAKIFVRAAKLSDTLVSKISGIVRRHSGA